MKRGVDYLIETQEKDGSWFGRWGMNYIYGTWSVLCAFNVAQVDAESPSVQRAIDFLKTNQNPDGGWGEGAETYERQYDGYQQADSTASQTAWALIALMAVGEIDDRRSSGASNTCSARRGPTGSGTSRGSPRRASRKCSTCATTATRSSSRCGPWRATATSSRATTAASKSACDCGGQILPARRGRKRAPLPSPLRGGVGVGVMTSVLASREEHGPPTPCPSPQGGGKPASRIVRAASPGRG